jgi:thiamine-phosphate pyrophosphorylase
VEGRGHTAEGRRLPPLYAILDAALAVERGYDPIDLARRYFDGGAKLLQLRAKNAPSGQFLDWSLAIAGLAARAGAVFIVNDRADIALMARAAGVHVGQDDMPAQAVRRLAPAPFILGLSTHTTEQIAAGARQPVDYLAIGPVFGTATKETGYAAVGLEMVREAARNAAGLPVVAIGGITLASAPSVLDAGAASVAVISDLLTTGAPEGRVREYLQAIGHRP